MNPLTVSFKAAAAPENQEDPGQFAYALIHEVRNPLANINMAVEMMEAELKDKGMDVYLDVIKRNSVRILETITDFVQYEPAEEAPAEQYSLTQLVDEVMEIAADRASLKNIAVYKEYSPEDYSVTLNRKQMKVALTNIVINAVEAMASQGGQLHLITKPAGDKYTLEIKDNGCGISKANMKNIFKAYYTNKPGGLGLGLTTVYDFLQSSNVAINVESEEGEGARFILLFDNPV